MLRRLLAREWMLHGRQCLLVLAMLAAFQIYFILRTDSARAWLVFTGVFMSFQTILPFTRDDKFQSGGWVCTLPVLRSQIVQARWAGAWLYILAGLLIALAMGLVLPGSRVDLAQALAPDTLLLTAATASLILLLLLPFTIRFGLMGVMIFLLVAQLGGAALFMVAIMAGGRAGGVGGHLHRFIEGTRAGLLQMHEAMTPAAFQVTALAALLLVNWVGYRLALALYRRREF